MFRTALRWLIFALSIVAMGLAFPFMFFRTDERPLLRDTFGLATHRGDPDDGEDSVEEAWAALAAKPWSPHQLKNILHEWTKESPKRAAKFLSFLVVGLALALVVSLAA